MDSSRENLKVASDEQLLAAFLSGDKPAFASLVERYQRDLFQFLYRFLGDSAAADDVFQEAFIQVYQSAGQFEIGRTFRPWLFTIAANKARDYLRSRNRRQSVSLQAAISPHSGNGHEYIELLQSADPGPESHLETDELRDRVMLAIQRLPEHLREVLLLAYFQQFPYKQISETLKVPLGTVKSRLHAAVEAFANIWKSTNPAAS
ncbi:MAG: sigma-70 family RNA polymerase sigma factor [Burkholderiales bacterium]|nr:sigma-70 family RNA polymerase sigma factor [Phycisphaerae bacterium]